MNVVKKSSVRKTVPASRMREQIYDYFLVLDFEATCDNNVSNWQHEIIEFPTVLVNAKTLEIEDEFHLYIKPEKNPILTTFCKELTGIKQEWVDSGVSFYDGIKLFDTWMSQKGLLPGQKNFVFVTCGDWDFNVMLPQQCSKLNIKRPASFSEWINIKIPFCQLYGRAKRLGMAGMLSFLGLPLEGRHHSGIDDCRNITRILIQMIQDGCVFHTTTSIGNSRIVEEIEKLEKEKRQIEDTLANSDFLQKARPEVISKTRKKVDDLSRKIEKCTGGLDLR